MYKRLGATFAPEAAGAFLATVRVFTLEGLAGMGIGERVIVKYSARGLGATACWIASALVLVFGTAALIDAIIGLDPDDRFYSVSIAFIFYIYGWFIALALILAGCALLLSSDKKAGVLTYLTALGVMSFGAAMTVLRQTDWNVVMLVVATGSFYVVWRRAAVLWQKQASLASGWSQQEPQYSRWCPCRSVFWSLLPSPTAAVTYIPALSLHQDRSR